MKEDDRGPQLVREFEGGDGSTWTAGFRSRDDKDYKGRYYFVARPIEGTESDEVWLEDVRWNSEKTASRTLETMSEVELRRRLRAARGRHEQRMGGDSNDLIGQADEPA